MCHGSNNENSLHSLCAHMQNILSNEDKILVFIQQICVVTCMFAFNILHNVFNTILHKLRQQEKLRKQQKLFAFHFSIPAVTKCITLL